MKRLLILLFVLTSPVVHAEEVGVVVSGDPTMQPALVKQIETWLKKNGHTVVGVAMPSDAVNTLVDCFVIEDEGCARGVVDKRGRAKVIIYARVDVQAGGDIDKTVTVSAYWFEKGQKPIPQRKFCERCGEAKLRTTIEELMVALMKAVPQGTGKVKLTSNPSGAICAIDGKPAGNTPLDQDLAPGPHEITVTRDRHETETRFITVKAGEITNVDVALRAAKPKSGSRLLPVLAMGAGGAMFATGVVMFAIDQDKGAAGPLEIRNTGPTGVGIGIAGVAVVAGGYLWFKMSGKRESQPLATVSRDSAYIAWLGRF